MINESPFQYLTNFDDYKLNETTETDYSKTFQWPVPEPKFEIQLPTKLMRIHLDISCDGTIFKDKVIWNFNETVITPEQYAEVIASKIDSSKASQFIPLIATQIRVQSDARKKVWFEENKNEIFYQESSFDKIQTSIKLDFNAGTIRFADQLDWPLFARHIESAEEFAFRLCTYLEVGFQFVPVIAHTINEQICTARLEFDRVNTLKREREATEKRRQMEQISKGSTSTTVSSTIATDSTPKTGKEIKKKKQKLSNNNSKTDDCLLSMDHYLNLINPLTHMTRMSFITPDMSAIIDPQGSALNVNTSTSNMMLDFTNGPAPFGHLSYNPVAPNTSAGMMAGSLSSASVNNSANNLFNHHQQHQSGDFSSSFQPQDFIQQQHKTMPHIPTTEYLQQQQHQPHILNELDSGSSNPSYSLNQQSVLSASSSSSSAAAANASCEPPSSSSYLLDHAHTHHQHHHHQQLPQQPLDMYGMIIPSHGGHHLSHGMSFLPPNGHIAPAAEGESMFGGSIMVPMLHGATNSLSSADMISQSATNYIINNEIGASATTTTTTSFINAPVAGSSAALCSTTNGTYGSKISKGSSGSSKSKKSNNNNSNNNSNIGPDGQPIKPERKRKEPAKINTEIVQKQIELMLSNNVFLANKAAAAADASISVEAAVVAAMANTSTTNSSTSSINKKHNLGSHLHEMEGGGGGEGSGANDVSLEGEDVSKCPKRHRGFGASAKIFNEDGTMEVGEFRKNWRCTWCLLSGKFTPTLRKGPLGAKTLCNACGIWYVKHGYLPVERCREHHDST